jgi:hypothetical protein
MAARGRKSKPKVQQRDISSLDIVRQILPLRNWLVERSVIAGTQPHGNTALREADVLVLLLAGFYNPFIRSLRLTEQLSQLDWIRKHTALERAPKSTLSDALKRFNPEHLTPLIQELVKQLPAGVRTSEATSLLEVGRQVIAADGSMFSLAGEVVWAMHRGGRPRTVERNGRPPAASDPYAVRLNLQLDVDTFLPTDLSVSGNTEGSEAAAFAKRITGGAVYLVDRNFVHFGFLCAVLGAKSDFVVRLRKDTQFQSTQSLPLCARDKEAWVLRDSAGVLSGDEGRTGPPPEQTLREVVVLDAKGEEMRLLTSLMDVPAWVIAELYRLRWQVELFLRWLKVYNGYEHLMSQSHNGITTQFYVAVIGSLLMYIHTGHKPNRYAVMLLGQVAAGLATMEEILPMLERIQREKDLERARLARKKAVVQKTDTSVAG